MAILHFPVWCRAWYDTKLTVPDGMTREEAFRYAKNHLEDIEMGELNYLADSDEFDDADLDFESRVWLEEDEKTPEEIFCHMAYELYKVDWLKNNVFNTPSGTLAKDEIKAYYKDGAAGCFTLPDWVEENGFAGSLYACYSEFLGAEFADRDYMKYLLGDNELFAQYEKIMRDGVIKGQTRNPRERVGRKETPIWIRSLRTF